jgi:hypothetical protein
MKIYIAGKIGNLPEEEFTEKFEKAKYQLVDLGYEAVTPLDFEHNHGRTWAEYMLEDLAELNKCDAICLLPCWTDSPGASIERLFAYGARKDVFHFEDIIKTV